MLYTHLYTLIHRLTHTDLHAHTQKHVCPPYIAFSVADTQLYKRLCLFVGPSVGPSVRLWAQVEKWENKRFRSFLYVCLGKGVGWCVGCGGELAAPAHPSATIFWPCVTCSSFTGLPQTKCSFCSHTQLGQLCYFFSLVIFFLFKKIFFGFSHDFNF